MSYWYPFYDDNKFLTQKIIWNVYEFFQIGAAWKSVYQPNSEVLLQKITTNFDVSNFGQRRRNIKGWKAIMVLPKKIFSVGMEGKKKVNGASGDQRREFLLLILRKS